MKMIRNMILHRALALLFFAVSSLICPFPGSCAQDIFEQEFFTSVRESDVSSLVYMLGSDDPMEKSLAYVELLSRGAVASPGIKRGLSDENAYVVILCAKLLWEMGDTSGVPPLISVLEGSVDAFPDSSQIPAWEEALAVLESIRYFDTEGLLAGERQPDRDEAAMEYASWWDQNRSAGKDELFVRAMDWMIEEMGLADSRTVDSITKNIYSITGRRAPVERQILDASGWDVKRWWAKNRSRSRLLILKDSFKDEKGLDRAYAATQLAFAGDRSVIPVLIEAITAPVTDLEQTRAQALGGRVYVALKILTGNSFCFRYHPSYTFYIPEEDLNRAYSEWKAYWERGRTR